MENKPKQPRENNNKGKHGRYEQEKNRMDYEGGNQGEDSSTRTASDNGNVPDEPRHTSKDTDNKDRPKK